jgi:hypothetical protein
MSTEKENQKEIRRIYRIIENTAQMAKEATLTGMLKGGESRCIKQFNSALNRLIETGVVPGGLFEPLEGDASFSEIGVACHHLASYLKDELEDESPRAEPQEPKSVPLMGDSVIVNLGGELKELGEVIRQSMPDFVRKAWKEATGAHTSHERTEHPKAEPPPKNETETAPPSPELNQVESQIAELGAQMQVLAERLRRNTLPPEEIQRIADEMRKLGEQQVKLADRHATFRAEGSS